MKTGNITREYLSTGEFAKAIGVSAATVVVWDKKNILCADHVTPTGRRHYTQNQVDEYLETIINKKRG